MTRDVLEKIREIEDLPTLPAVAVEVLALAQSPDVTIRRLSEVIHGDPALSTKVLRVANSAYYRRATGPIETIQRAVMLLGLNEIVNLTSTVTILSSFGTAEDDGRSVRRAFWDHCVACALIARKIARVIGMEARGREFVAGLLHDIGKIVLDEYYHAEFMEAYHLSLEEDRPMYVAEERLLGSTHMVIGEYLAGRWHLPGYLGDVIRWHHDPARAGEQELAAVVSLADMLARAKLLACGGDRLAIVIEDQDAWRILRAKGYPLDELDLERFTFEMDDLQSEVHTYLATVSDLAPEEGLDGHP